MIKWILIILVVLVALVALMSVIGLMLPKGHKASRTARIRQPAGPVWTVVTDFARWPTWNRAIKSMTRGSDHDGKPVWVQAGTQGKMPLAVEEMAPSRMVTRIADPHLPFGGRWIWEISPDGDGCKVTITEDGEIYNPLFRFMARFVFGYRSTMDGYLQALGQKYGGAELLD